MNPSGHYGRNGGYGRAIPVRGSHNQPGRIAAGAPETRGSFIQKKSCGYGQRALHQRQLQHSPAQPHAHEQDDIDTAFNWLRTHPQKALDVTEVLLNRYRARPSDCVRILQLKGRALLQLHKIDDCIAFINALEPGMRHDKGLLLTKARALQAKGCCHEALPLFQRLYSKYKASYKDHKAHGLALGRHLQLMGGENSLEKALAIFTQLRTRTAGGGVHRACDDKDIELALGRLLQELGGADNLQRALAIYTRLRRRAARRPNTPCDDKDIELTLGRHL